MIPNRSERLRLKERFGRHRRLMVARGNPRELYATASGKVFIKTEGGIKELK
jgi:hypothetical protein